MYRISLPAPVRHIIELLNHSGYRADVVGGSVRDFLLGNIPDDYDITTSATPEEMKQVFSGYRTVETGIKHGTLTVIIDSTPYEITTYRLDGDYKDHRHPESVSFSREIAHDLSRRDFTMNAIAYNENDGITDLFFGTRDIENKIIRAVGNAETRFTEDALRILRAIRFAAKLGFSIDSETASAARAKKELLSFVSGERIFAEWKKLLEARYAYAVISEYKDIISEFLLPGKNISMPTEEKFSLGTVSLRQLSLIMLSAEDAYAAFTSLSDRLRFDNETKKEGITLIENYNKVTLDTEMSVRRALYTLGKKHTEAMITLKIMLGDQDSVSYSILKNVIDSRLPYSISHLEISGDDLISLGMMGKSVGNMLERVLYAVIDGEISNEREEILDYVKNTTGNS